MLKNPLDIFDRLEDDAIDLIFSAQDWFFPNLKLKKRYGIEAVTKIDVSSKINDRHQLSSVGGFELKLEPSSWTTYLYSNGNFPDLRRYAFSDRHLIFFDIVRYTIKKLPNWFFDFGQVDLQEFARFSGVELPEENISEYLRQVNLARDFQIENFWECPLDEKNELDCQLNLHGIETAVAPQRGNSDITWKCSNHDLYLRQTQHYYDIQYNYFSSPLEGNGVLLELNSKYKVFLQALKFFKLSISDTCPASSILMIEKALKTDPNFFNFLEEPKGIFIAGQPIDLVPLESFSLQRIEFPIGNASDFEISTSLEGAITRKICSCSPQTLLNCGCQCGHAGSQ